MGQTSKNLTCPLFPVRHSESMHPEYAEEELSEFPSGSSCQLCCHRRLIAREYSGAKTRVKFLQMSILPIVSLTQFSSLPSAPVALDDVEITDRASERRPCTLHLPRPPNTFPAANTRAWASVRQKGPCPERDALFAQTKAPPVHLDTSKT